MPLNEASVVMVPLPCGQLEHRAVARRAAVLGGAEEIAAAVLDQAGLGDRAAVGAVEGGQGGDACRCPGHLEHRAVSSYGAAICVVPKRLPLLSSTRPPTGLAPLVPLKEASVVMVPLPATSNTVP